MAPLHIPCLLLCLVPLLVSVVHSKDADYEVYWWSKQSLPVVLNSHTELLNTPRFSGQEDNGRQQVPEKLCGIECQSKLPSLDQAEQERILGYESVYENGTRTWTKITLQGFNNTSPRLRGHAPTRSRGKRQVYGADGRFVISDSRFTTKYPFSTAVRLSTGCSGVLVSPKHVLTAAHCVHDGRDYLGSVQWLKVGVLQLRSTRKRTGGRRAGRRKGAMREKVDIGEEKPEEGGLREGEEQNSIDGDLGRRRQGGKGRRRRQRKGDEQGEGDLRNMKGGGIGEGEQGRPSLDRVRRSVGPIEQPVFRWTRVKQTRLPAGWIHAGNNSVSADYDYALLELKRPVAQKHMELGVAPSSKPLARIHFSGYDADKGRLSGHGGEKVVYRFCSVTKESDDLLYQHCDAEQGAAGAGVYIRRKQETGSAGSSGKGNWQRRVIGVFSGHRWVELEGGDQRDFNVAVRITPPKYAQICHWIHADPRLCKEV